MEKLKLGTEIEFDKKEVKKYLDLNTSNMLSGDERRNLTIRAEYSNHFVIGYFNNYTKAYIQGIGKIYDENYEEGEEKIPETFRMVVPVECIKKRKEQTKPLVKLKLYIGDIDEDEFFKKMSAKINKRIEKVMDKNNKAYDLMEGFVEIILSTILHKNIENQDKIGEIYKHIVDKKTLEEKSNLYSEIIPLYNDKDISRFLNLEEDISRTKKRFYLLGEKYEDMKANIEFKNDTLTLEFNIVKDDTDYEK